MSVVLNAPNPFTAYRQRLLIVISMRRSGWAQTCAAPRSPTPAKCSLGRSSSSCRPRSSRATCRRSAFSARDLDALVDGVRPQQRVLKNAPRAVTRDDLRGLFRGALAY
jgi:hypothetical protein